MYQSNDVKSQGKDATKNDLVTSAAAVLKYSFTFLAKL
jgi:hypothetical protein